MRGIRGNCFIVRESERRVIWCIGALQPSAVMGAPGAFSHRMEAMEK